MSARVAALSSRFDRRSSGFKTWGVRSRRPLVVDVEVLGVVLSLSRPEGAPSGRRRLGPRGMQLGSFIRR